MVDPLHKVLGGRRAPSAGQIFICILYTVYIHTPHGFGVGVLGSVMFLFARMSFVDMDDYDREERARQAGDVDPFRIVMG